MAFDKIKKKEASDYSTWSCSRGAILVEDDVKDKAIEVLTKEDVPHQYFPTPLEAFYFEEAKFRMYGNYDLSELSTEEINELADEISDAMMDDDYIIDGDALDDIATGIIDSYMNQDDEEEVITPEREKEELDISEKELDKGEEE